MKPRVITAQEFATARNWELGTEMQGRVLWYDTRDATGVILGSNGEEYTFTMGKLGHIGTYKSNMVIDDSGIVSERQQVKFIPCNGCACDIKSLT